jgi:multimeric flavodoxin WrbA
MRKGEESCPIKDDALSLRDRLRAADGVIFASPVYVHTISALLKNFFDRFAYFLHRPAFFGIPALTIVTTELSGLPETVKYLAFPVKAMGFWLLHEIGVIAPAFYEEGRYRESIMGEIELASGLFFDAIEGKTKPSPTLSDVVFFNKLKTKITIHRERFPFDYHFWEERGWFSRDYFTDAKIDPMKKVLGRLPVMLIRSLMRLRLGGAVYRKLIGENNGRE